MDIKGLSKPLPIENIEFRTQSIKKTPKGVFVVILAYKDARVDMQRLDDVVGALNWKREHTRDNKNCVVSIWCSDKKEWVSKEDTGTESNTEKEKGLASDSFKRACFNWGIGRELYDFPMIRIQLQEGEYTEYQGNVKESFFTSNLQWKAERDDNGKLLFLGAYKKGTLRWSYGKLPNNTNNTPPTTTKDNTSTAPVNKEKPKLGTNTNGYNNAFTAYRDALSKEAREAVRDAIVGSYADSAEVLKKLEKDYTEYLKSKNKL